MCADTRRALDHAAVVLVTGPDGVLGEKRGGADGNWAAINDG
jgi:hypothetical protein